MSTYPLNSPSHSQPLAVFATGGRAPFGDVPPRPESRPRMADPRRPGNLPGPTRGYPLVVARGYGSTIEDVDGNRFLDFTAGIAVNSTGHCHPDVVAAITEQAGRLLHMSGTDFYYSPEIELAERLARLAPVTAEAGFFCNSGTEAIEAALKLVRYHTRRQRSFRSTAVSMAALSARCRSAARRGPPARLWSVALRRASIELRLLAR